MEGVRGSAGRVEGWRGEGQVEEVRGGWGVEGQMMHLLFLTFFHFTGQFPILNKSNRKK